MKHEILTCALDDKHMLFAAREQLSVLNGR